MISSEHGILKLKIFYYVHIHNSYLNLCVLFAGTRNSFRMNEVWSQ